MGEHWYNSLYEGAAGAVGDVAELAEAEVPGVATTYHGAQSAYHAMGALMSVADAEVRGDYSPETQNMIVDQAGEAGAQAIEALPGVSIAMDLGDGATGGGLHEAVKKEVIGDTMGDEYRDAPDTPEAKESTLNQVGDMIFKPWWAQF